ncbi:replicative DNA helicase [Deinococcus malanensis]|uniref:Replicative DNA helicase n=1 Tax=Deinococcus malanensis TaxID=1706855 RepID=A0ABQ2EJI2_9DEIO|nr:DnaB-like helicase C-terminal domain-containing protein [Deinococcus malanensis]GGK11376.1 replicative DNA helicase [Deinococcus malanensis]
MSGTATLSRPLPTNPELEHKALACVLIDPTVWPSLSEMSEGAWTSAPARSLWGVFRSLNAAGLPLDDLGTITQRATETGQGQTVNLAYLQGLLTLADMTAYYAPFYAEQLRFLHGRREVTRNAFQLIHHAVEGDLNAEELATLASQLGSALEVRSRHQFTTHAQAIDAALADIESPLPNAITTGYADLDDQILGFEPGAMYVLAARPAMGKTAMGYSFALTTAKSGRHVGVASLEMPAKALALRALATAASVDLNRIRQRTTNGPDRERLRMHASRTRGLPITYLEATDQTGASIARDARKLRAAGQLDLLLIDYLQLVESGRSGSENRVQEVSHISRLLKKLAMELQIPVIVLSQLSRAVEARPNKRPVLSDLRESGAIEQDADTVMFIYRDEYYHPNTDQQGIAEVIVGKQRNGPVGSVRLAYNSEFVRFANLSRAEPALL